MAERAVVVRKTRVRFSPSTLLKMVKILFVCKYNAFRSPVAEKYFKKISSEQVQASSDKNVRRNKNPRNQVISEGLIMGGKADKEQVRIAREVLGIDISNRKPAPLDLDDMIEADKIIVVAKDIPKKIFDYQLEPIMKKVVVWRIKDEQKMNQKNIKKIILKIKKKVDELNKELEKGK